MENNSVKLRVISSSSAGNAYALDSGTEILLLEAGIRHSVMTRDVGFRDDKVVGCLISHCHGDHAKYAEEYAKRGIHIYCNKDVREKKRFPYGSYTEVQVMKTYDVGSFRICPFPLHHDVPNFAYLIHHPQMGTCLFALDTYKFDFSLENVDHFLIEANYDDKILKANIQDGRIDRAQANRLMLSHMSLDNTNHFLQECHAETAKTITLCHLSERNSDPDLFRRSVESAFGIPCNIARKGLVIELNKEVI